MKKLSKAERKIIMKNYRATPEHIEKTSEAWDRQVVMAFEAYDILDDEPSVADINPPTETGDTQSK